MLYYTQIIFVKEGQEGTFHSFEDLVLPLLRQHNGELIYRIRPTVSSVITTAFGHPYEIHLVSFADRKSFENYRDDPDRLQYMKLKEESVDRVILIEGSAL
ncbi:DUF1330 domain-containing protein [Dyadobacter sp. NIV53]|uniref:DUF1330 domain-containing protein n=1 Tax=Dyadobacter sp. NIV53 TaxID=2861765 RepID=UPI001C8828A5|nr:DUF1330 domain-containing protein [Dyadobacter sp. NIV53]